MENLTARIKRMLLEAGFEAVGITPAAMPEKSRLLNEWLDTGRHGEMGWMARYRGQRLDIRKLFPGARSVVCVAQNYYTPHEQTAERGRGRISRYAWGRDYHKIIPRRLKKVLAALQEDAARSMHYALWFVGSAGGIHDVNGMIKGELFESDF